MNNQEKAIIYDECIRQTEVLQRENSKLKSEHAGNIPSHIQMIITRNDEKIKQLVAKVESLF